MNALEKIFQGYYNERMDGECSDPVEMQEAFEKIMTISNYITVGTPGELMENVSLYGMEAEKTGFMAGFRMAWDLLKNMQEIPA